MYRAPYAGAALRVQTLEAQTLSEPSRYTSRRFQIFAGLRSLDVDIVAQSLDCSPAGDNRRELYTYRRQTTRHVEGSGLPEAGLYRSRRLTSRRLRARRSTLSSSSDASPHRWARSS